MGAPAVEVVIAGSANDVVLSFIRANPNATKQQIADGLSDLTDGQIRNALYKLKKEGHITTAGRGQFVTVGGTPPIAPPITPPKVTPPKPKVTPPKPKVTQPEPVTGLTSTAKDAQAHWKTLQTELDDEVDKLIKSGDIPSHHQAALRSRDHKRRLDTISFSHRKYESPRFNRLKDLIEDEFKAYTKYVEDAGGAIEARERRRIIKSLIKGNPGEVYIQRTIDGTEYIKFEQLADLQRREFRVIWKRGEGRAYCNLREIVLYTADDTSLVVSHEFGHGLDHLYATRRGHSFLGHSGGQWVDNAYVTAKEGDDYIAWFTKQRAPYNNVKKAYTNGDGWYWEDNWLHNYEGRIYEYRGAGTGAEWIAMNSQRYSAYYKAQVDFVNYKRLQGIRIKEFTDTVMDDFNYWMRTKDGRRTMDKVFVDEFKEVFGMGPKRALSREYHRTFDYGTRTKMRGFLQWRPSENARDWLAAKDKYPELTSFMEKKFRTLPSKGAKVSSTVLKQAIPKSPVTTTIPKIKVATKGMSAANTTILDFIKINPNATAADILQNTGLTHNQVRNGIWALKKKGHIIPGAKKGQFVVDPIQWGKPKASALYSTAKPAPGVSKPMTAVERLSVTGYSRKNGKWYFKDKLITDDKVVNRLKSMRVPPAWKKVYAVVDPKAKVQAVGKDAAGRWQYRFSAKHMSESSRKKFDRLKLFDKDIKTIKTKMKQDIAKGDQRAYLLDLEYKTAIRAGSKTDFKAKVKAYGLTTLQHEHVTISGNKIMLDFVAKKGITAKYELVDDKLASWLKGRLDKTRPGDMLFPDISAPKLNKYIRNLANGKKYSIKDFRTYHGTRIAKEELEQYAGQILTDKEKKDIVKRVSEKASQFLKNEPIVAKNSYIDPMVWEVIGGL